MNYLDFFTNPQSIIHKKYETLRAFFVEHKKAEEIAKQFGYEISSVYTLIRDFKADFKKNPNTNPFFKETQTGRKLINNSELEDMIISMRKQNYATTDIMSAIDAKQYKVSYGYVYDLLKKHGFARLPRRTKEEKKELKTPKIVAPKTEKLILENESFSSNNVALLTFLPYLEKYGINKIIEQSDFPETSEISKLSSILSFLALKLFNIRRYSADDLRCMDRGGGLFAGLNVLPKAAWFTSYSHRVTKEMNYSFLKLLHKIWLENGLLSDTVNLDFTSIPYRGDGDNEHLENNRSGKRNKSLASMLAVLAQDPDSGIIDYSNTDILHKDESAVVLEYLDFYKKNSINNDLKYLIFDSKFTNYENLSKLDDNDVKFITIRRRGKNIVDDITNIGKKEWKSVRVDCADNKGRTLKVCDKKIFLKGYNKDIRQVIITGNGKIKPALIITNDFEIPTNQVIRKYARRRLVEKGISEQIEFFHLNKVSSSKVSSSMVIKVDFDLIMSVLAHNLYRLFALDLDRYSHLSDLSIYEKFIANSGFVEITEEKIIVSLKKKRNLPQILENMKAFEQQKYNLLGTKKIIFQGACVS